jgi:uncharacterized membrane protein
MRAVGKGPLRVVFLFLLLGVGPWLGPGLTGVRAVDDMGAMDDLCAGDMQWMVGWCLDTIAGNAPAAPSALTAQGGSSPYVGVFEPVDVTGAAATRVFGINPEGDIVGSYTDATGTHGFVLSNGDFATIDYPGAATTEAWGINPRGDIIGRYTRARVAGVRGFLLSHGSYTDISIGNHLITLPTKIGASGEIVGCFHDASPLTDMYGYVRRGNSVTSFALPPKTVPAGSSAMHNGITPGGRTVVGLTFDGALNRAHGYVIKDGGEPTLLAFHDSTFTSLFTQAWDVNPRGTIVGQYSDAANGTHGFYLDENGYVAIDVPKSLMTVARGINPQGDIVGVYSDATGTHGFVLRR